MTLDCRPDSFSEITLLDKLGLFLDLLLLDLLDLTLLMAKSKTGVWLSLTF